MQDSKNPIVRERLLAVAVFGAVAIGGAAAVDTMVTGGFDFPVARDEARQHSRHVFASIDEWAVTPRAEPVSWTAAPPVTEEFDTTDDLDGGAIAEDEMHASTEAEIYDEIHALYEETEPAPEDNATVVTEAAAPASGKDASAYETASPW